MAKHTPARNENPPSAQTLAVQASRSYNIEVVNALPMRRYVLDLARHSTLAPDGKRYVVATFDDTHLHNGYVTAVYPQQYDYLTLVSLEIAHFSSATPEAALKRHLTAIQAIQQGKLAGLPTAA
ncbi:MAG TPA: hypothetical protein VNE61_09300 [Ktedonobacteraceae bacterium]|jgi:hypothetical protein|nr:hypothetical protein [Ktedonobacteraceae bacterium]